MSKADSDSLLFQRPRHVPPLHPDFSPLALGNLAYRDRARGSGKAVPLAIGLERNDGARSLYRTEILPPGSEEWPDTLRYLERIVKSLLWSRGGVKLTLGGPPEAGESIRRAYAPGGPREFDAGMMARIYERPFEVVVTGEDRVPAANEPAVRRGGHLDGCRIGFDAGASDRKVAAVIDGKPVFSEEVIWNPKEKKDPGYHFDEIMAALRAAAAHLPRVDAIGVSSAGVYVKNRVMVASLFRGVPPDLFESRVKNLFLEIRRAWKGVPLEVCNDGDVTALAGSMSLGTGAVLGIAMGSSQAAGYVSPAGTLTDWLSELAFVPVDYGTAAPVDEWSGDAGCGVQYFSQVAAIRLAVAAGLEFPPSLTPAEKLKQVQAALDSGDERASRIFDSIGCYLGYAIAHYADFYDFRNVLVLGRVTSGKGGEIILDRARAVLRDEFPNAAKKVSFHLPEEETERRHGQAVAAASLPSLGR